MTADEQNRTVNEYADVCRGRSADSSVLRSLIAGHVLQPVTAGIEVWLDGVGQAGRAQRKE